METYKFDRTDLEELYFALSNFEKNYKVKFGEEEFEKIESFEDFIERIIAKFDFAEMQDCTYQQAFYKLRKAIKEVDPNIVEITLDTKLKDIFPLNNRKPKIADLSEKLGIRLKILTANSYEFFSLLIMVLFSIGYLFYNFFLGLFLLSLFVGMIQIALDKGNAFAMETIRDLVNHLVQQHYFECRKDSNTINKKEFKNVILDYFAEEMCLDKEQLKTARFM